MAGEAKALAMPFQEAIDYLLQKQPRTSSHWTEYLNEAHARSFVVAGAAKQAIVDDFKAAIDKAISQGTGFREFRGDFEDIVKRHGWQHTGTPGWRAKIIYQTNMANAYSAGRYAQQTDPDVLAAFPYWEYLHVNCPHPRLQHVAWSGMVLRADDPWWDTHYPPNGWNCHCIVGVLNDRGLAARGLSGPQKAPPMDWRTYVNKTTGVVSRYPAGVDPGFAYNPGLAWKKGQPPVVRAPRVRPEEKMAPPVLAQPGAAAVRPDVLAAFLKAPGDTAIQIGEMHEPGLANAPAPVVLTPVAVKEAAKAGVPIDAALAAELADVAARNEGNPHEKTKTLTVRGLAALLRWESEAAFWVVTTFGGSKP